MHNNIFILACECYIMSTLCFKNHDFFGAIGWAIEAYNKWMENGQPKCVDIEKLYLYLLSSSVCTGKLYVVLICCLT